MWNECIAVIPTLKGSLSFLIGPTDYIFFCLVYDAVKFSVRGRRCNSDFPIKHGLLAPIYRHVRARFSSYCCNFDGSSEHNYSDGRHSNGAACNTIFQLMPISVRITYLLELSQTNVKTRRVRLKSYWEHLA